MKAEWQTSTLGDVLAVIRNGVNCKQDKSGNGDRISRIESISDATFDLDKVGYADLSERDKEKNRLQPGDILFSHINSAVHVGKTAVFDCDEPVYHGVNLLLMRPKEVVTSAYLDHALKYLFQCGYWRGVCKQSVNQASVNQQDISRVEIRFPKSLAEQQRIVEILDEAFEGLATAKANAEKNLQNARALFESHLQSVFTQRGLGWVETTLEICCEQIFAGGDVPKDRFSEERTPNFSVPIYSNGEKKDGLYGFTDVARVMKPSITVSARGTLGFTVIRTEPFLPVVRLIVLVPDESQITLSFLYYAVVGMDFGNTGTSIPQLTVPNFKESKLHVPSLSEQASIAKKLDALREETQCLARIYEQKIAALDELKKSLLHQAFTGQL